MSRVTRERLSVQVARRIAAARRAHGWTQDQLATALDIAPRNMQRLESGKQNLTLETIEKVADALAIAPESLLPGAPSRVWPGGGRRPALVPLVSIEAAAGYLRDERSVRPEGWCVVEASAEGSHFAARVVGRSMTPTIPENALAHFAAPAGPLARGTIYLWQVRATGAPEDGGSFLVKRYGGRRTTAHAAVVTLVSDQPRVDPLTLTADAGRSVEAIARFIEVVDAEPPTPRR